MNKENNHNGTDGICLVFFKLKWQCINYSICIKKNLLKFHGLFYPCILIDLAFSDVS